MHPRSLLVAALIVASFTAWPRAARADDTAPEDATTLEARKEFLRGGELVQKERWGDALDAFEHADKLKPHAITTYNIAQCQRATGQYTLARKALVRALAQDDAERGQLPESVRGEAKGLMGEIDRILPRIAVTLAPEDAAIAVDGRPIERPGDEAGTAVFVAGTRTPGPGESPGMPSFELVANPGAHVITVSRRGYQDVVVNRTFSPGSRSLLDLRLDRLPATIHVTSSLADAVVRVNDADVGNPPVDVSRNAGAYRVTVTRTGYLTYETEVTARPGERVEIAAPMREEKRALTQKWWFWTAAGVLVVGAAATTYFLTRPAPTRPAPDGGGLGWSLRVP
jgi:hypothetical protein